MSTWELTAAITLLLLPPGCLLLIAVAGLATVRRHPGLGRGLVALSFVALYVLSTQFVANELLRTLEPKFSNPLANRKGQAIVVLGGGKYFAAPEYESDTVSAETLTRLRYTAHLYRATGKPVLVTGGAPEGSPTDEASAMKSVLELEFQVPVTWRERHSDSTLENARLSARILQAAGIRTIYLVTNAWHMPRAILAFEHAGVTVIPAPTRFATAFRLNAKDFLPKARALRDSSRFFHEIIGIAWYRLRFAVERLE